MIGFLNIFFSSAALLIFDAKATVSVFCHNNNILRLLTYVSAVVVHCTLLERGLGFSLHVFVALLVSS